MGMKNSTRDAIVDDLLLKFPKGATRKLRKHDYIEDSKYCYESGRYKTIVKTTEASTHWGYLPVVLFDVGFKSEREVRSYVETRFYEGRNVSRGGYGGCQAGVTRKTNRLWGRISLALQEVKTMAVEGVYKLQAGSYGSALGHIHAGSPQEARNVALAMFSHVLNKTEKARLSSELVSRTSIEDVLKFNQSIFSRVRRDIKGELASISESEARIEKAKQRLEAMINLETLLLNKDESDCEE